MTSAATPLIAELGTIALAVVVSVGSAKVQGWRRTYLFIAGSILWTTIVENVGVLEGAYTYYGYAGSLLPNYPGYLIWIGLVPLWVELGWIIVTISLYILLKEVLLKNRGALARAMVAGLLAVNIDLVVDPVAVSNGLWKWLGPSYYFLGVPFYNWMGWFILVFFYTLTFESTLVAPTRMLFLGPLEARLYPGWAASSTSTARFAFRLVVVNLVAAAILTTLSTVMVPQNF